MLENTIEFIYKCTIKQIHFDTLIILFCLMGVVVGFTRLGYIDTISRALINKANNLKMLMLVSVLVTYVMSMLVTNDVGLIVMVPFTIKVLQKVKRKDKMIKLIVLETLAANLGGMATPIGNPHNLYTYQFYNMEPMKFIITLMPYVIVSLTMLVLIVWLDKDGKDEVKIGISENKLPIITGVRKNIYTIVYSIIFVLCVGVVLGRVNCYIVFAIELMCILICDRKVIKEVNYGLLIKFVVLFIIVGNLAQLPWINDKLHTLVKGNEFFITVAFSQFLSNLPVAIMLSRFTTNGYDLMMGANIGGLGTLIASMASMISYEYYGKEQDSDKKSYAIEFTKYNVVFLVCMIIVNLMCIGL